MGLELMRDSEVIADRVIEIIAEQAMLDPSEVTRDSPLSELGIDSLGIVECIFAIEESFDVTVPFNANTPEQPGFDVSSVGAIIGEVEKLVARQAA